MWRCTGPRWSRGAPGTAGRRFEQGLGWYCAERGEERVSPLPAGKVLAFAARGERRCLGVRRGGRWTVCPYGAVLAGDSARDQCASCARLDRSRSVAADTMADDPRPYGVYLAYFGRGLLKVGITAAERGPARLVEQGAVAYAWLGRGPLMAARRAEALLGSALAVPDRFGKTAKRAARGALPPLGDRRAELAHLHDAARELPGWPETLEPVGFECVDHAELFGLGRVPAEVAELGGLAAGEEIVGEVVAGVGSDLYLRLRDVRLPGAGEAPGGGGPQVAVLDLRVLSGWVLGAASGTVTTVPVRGREDGPAEGHDGQEGLF
ncbi:DUF2797 domain-containing protein [Streptomyces chattanoogensis]|uniref:DUF2797 domain-containing protein n=1 Tax=Streptomyces chattanoogensis TaxID=66876 RepID=UPI000D14B9B2|nr:DUF2797 domain-containing protein [Streptomyces chattanoogensis]